LRATKVAAAAPNRRIIGGAGTGVPPVELDDEPPLEEEVERDEEVELLLEDELLELVLELPLVLPEEPKLLDPPVAPELVEELVDEPPVAPELVDVLAPELVDVDEVEVELPWLEEP
jgi:hypothetical protein